MSCLLKTAIEAFGLKPNTSPCYYWYDNEHVHSVVMLCPTIGVSHISTTSSGHQPVNIHLQLLMITLPTLPISTSQAHTCYTFILFVNILRSIVCGTYGVHKWFVSLTVAALGFAKLPGGHELRATRTSSVVTCICVTGHNATGFMVW
jgi:hypothetical protein